MQETLTADKDRVFRQLQCEMLLNRTQAYCHVSWERVPTAVVYFGANRWLMSSCSAVGEDHPLLAEKWHESKRHCTCQTRNTDTKLVHHSTYWRLTPPNSFIIDMI